MLKNNSGGAVTAGTSNVFELMTRNLRQSGIYIAFVAIVVLFTVLTQARCSHRATSPTWCCSTPTS